MNIVLGTRNRKKKTELELLLRPYGFAVRSLDEFPQAVEVVEDGESFAENAAKKSDSASRPASRVGPGGRQRHRGGRIGRRPGIYSARWAGPDATDEENNRRLLDQLADVPKEKRTANYVCHMSLSDPQGRVHIDCEAVCHGWLRTEAAGTGGFGYDPLFEIPEYHRTFGELGTAVKSVLSHRARASRQFLQLLLRLVNTDNG